MSDINWHYPRKDLAKRYLDGVTSGIMNRIALLGVRRVGKTEFLLHDLYPLAMKAGYLPIYINLWASPEAPHEAIANALQKALSSKGERSALVSVLSAEIRKLEVGNNTFGKLGMEFDGKAPAIPASDLIAIADLLEQLVTNKKLKPLLMIDEIQHLASPKSFLPLQGALRTAFDTHGEKLPVVYAGSSRSGIAAMFADKSMPFYNSAYIAEFPVLDEGFVRHCTAILEKRFRLSYDNLALQEIFTNKYDHSPFWFSKLVQHLIFQQCGISEAVSYIDDQIIRDGNFESLEKKLNPTDKAVLVLIKEKHQGLYTEAANHLFKHRFGLTVKDSGITAALKKLKRQQIVSQLARNEYIIENVGFIDYLLRKQVS